jgi:hypothetical protein
LRIYLAVPRWEKSWLLRLTRIKVNALSDRSIGVGVDRRTEVQSAPGDIYTNSGRSACVFRSEIKAAAASCSNCLKNVSVATAVDAQSMLVERKSSGALAFYNHGFAAEVAVYASIVAEASTDIEVATDQVKYIGSGTGFTVEAISIDTDAGTSSGMQ